jgi:hypothetical protein
LKPPCNAAAWRWSGIAMVRHSRIVGTFPSENRSRFEILWEPYSPSAARNIHPEFDAYLRQVQELNEDCQKTPRLGFDRDGTV